jgi:hypothetical protein
MAEEAEAETTVACPGLDKDSDCCLTKNDQTETAGADNLSEPRPAAEDESSQPDLSNTMKDLLARRQQTQTWLKQVNRKIFEMETTYIMDECQFGNFIKGWDLDGRLGPYRTRTQVEDKERLFSFSSYSTWLEKKMSQEADKASSTVATLPAGTRTINQHKAIANSNRKNHKKRKTDVDDFLFVGDD